MRIESDGFAVLEDCSAYLKVAGITVDMKWLVVIWYARNESLTSIALTVSNALQQASVPLRTFLPTCTCAVRGAVCERPGNISQI